MALLVPSEVDGENSILVATNAAAFNIPPNGRGTERTCGRIGELHLRLSLVHVVASPPLADHRVANCIHLQRQRQQKQSSSSRATLKELSPGLREQITAAAL